MSFAGLLHELWECVVSSLEDYHSIIELSRTCHYFRKFGEERWYLRENLLLGTSLKHGVIAEKVDSLTFKREYVKGLLKITETYDSRSRLYKRIEHSGLGKVDGKHTVYYPSGKVSKCYYRHQGKREGSMEVYDCKGRIRSRSLYLEGERQEMEEWDYQKLLYFILYPDYQIFLFPSLKRIHHSKAIIKSH